ncbi:MAG TPA: cytochrome P450 [Azospirillaceae bacterium]|nr:cytochrome P450 [Azospirillaceae bacterium]
MTAHTMPARDALPMASLADTWAAFRDVVLPTLSKGVIIRRPRIVGVAERKDLDHRAIHRLMDLRERYGEGPLMLAIPGRRHALILAPEHVGRVLEGTPHPFSPATKEKIATLSHLEPHASLISSGPERAPRRLFNEQALDTPRRAHGMAAPFLAVMEQEMGALLREARACGRLDWDMFMPVWYATVRRIVLGDSARDDKQLTDDLAKLRGSANWAFLKPRRNALLASFHKRVDAYLARAERGSLAARIATLPRLADGSASHQVAHWLFAFDPAGMATFRTLALLVSHPMQCERARREIEAAGPDRSDLPYMRACLLESLRLWPTTPVILRETTEPVRWENGVMPANTSVAIFAPLFHRDPDRLPHADRFAPETWLDGHGARQKPRDWPLVPFSGGPGLCPAHNLVPMLGTSAVATLLDHRPWALEQPGRLSPMRPLPGTLDNYTVALTLRG